MTSAPWWWPNARFIFRLMVEKGIRRLPVVEDGRVVGIVTERDLLRWVDAVATA